MLAQSSVTYSNSDNMGRCRIRANSTHPYKLFFGYEIAGPVLELEKACLFVNIDIVRCHPGYWNTQRKRDRA